MHSQKVRNSPFLSFRRRPESRKNKDFWTPAFAGVTARGTFYESIKLDELVKSPSRSLRGATRRGNLLAIQGVMSLPWRNMPESIEVDGDSYDFTLESEVSLPGLGQGLPRFARNDEPQRLWRAGGRADRRAGLPVPP